VRHRWSRPKIGPNPPERRTLGANGRWSPWGHASWPVRSRRSHVVLAPLGVVSASWAARWRRRRCRCREDERCGRAERCQRSRQGCRRRFRLRGRSAFARHGLHRDRALPGTFRRSRPISQLWFPRRHGAHRRPMLLRQLAVPPRSDTHVRPSARAFGDAIRAYRVLSSERRSMRGAERRSTDGNFVRQKLRCDVCGGSWVPEAVRVLM
jgi:hypothetical protein